MGAVMDSLGLAGQFRADVAEHWLAKSAFADPAFEPIAAKTCRWGCWQQFGIVADTGFFHPPHRPECLNPPLQFIQQVGPGIPSREDSRSSMSGWSVILASLMLTGVR